MATMVIDLPEDLKGLEAPIRAIAETVQRRVRAARGDGRSVDYARVEADLAEQAAAIERAAHGVTLQALDIDEPFLMIGGQLHRRVVRTPGTFRSMAGPVAVERSRYRPVSERNADTVDVISVRTGAVGDGWLPATSSGMAHAMQQTTSREAAVHAERTFRLRYSRSSFENIAHLVGHAVVERRSEVEDKLIERLAVPEDARTISVSVDRVTIPMEEPRKRGPGRPRKGAAKKPIQRVHRMGYVGTVSLHDADGNALHTIRYGRMPAGDVPGLMRALQMDAKALLEQRPDLDVVALADGAAELWNLLRSYLDEEELGTSVFFLLDFWHLTEKLAAALRVMDGGESELPRYKMLLLNRKDAVDRILGELRASGKRGVRVGASRPVHEAITYLENNRCLMNYTTATRRGYPIGSGVVEATCKSLFQVRMKRPGSRWKNDSGDEILHLRALGLSDRWDDAVKLSLSRLRQPVRKVAA